MTMVFLTCAVIGGTILLCQFVLTFVGLSDLGSDIVDDLPSADEIEFDLGDGGSGSLEHAPTHSYLGDWLFGIISFRTIVAFLTFFGIAGMASHSAGLSLGAQFTIALAVGLASMYVVHGLTRFMLKLTQDGTIRVERAVGKTGVVYLAIAPHRARPGKIHLSLQQRQMEFNAVTSGDARLVPGAKVVVTAVISGDTLEVEPVPAEKPAETTAA